jgi:hypothetical protein
MGHELGDPSVVSAKTNVYVTNEVYFQSLFEIFKKNDKYISIDLSSPLASNICSPDIARMLHNYMRWGLVRTYIEDLSYNYIHTLRAFMDDYLGYPIHTSNDVYCTREAIRRFPLAIQRLYSRNSTTYSDATQTVSHARVLPARLLSFVSVD